MVTGLPSKKRGSALFLVLVLTVVLLLMMAAVGNRTVHDLIRVDQASAKKKARFAAFGGLRIAVSELQQDETWPGSGLRTEARKTLPGSNELDYQLRILNNVAPGPVIRALQAPDRSWVPGMAVWVESIGYTKDDKHSFGVVALLSNERPVFDHAAYGSGPIELRNGSTVDGWDSQNGPYQGDFDPSNPATHDVNAPVGSNDSITVDGSSAVDGDASVGTSGSPGGVPNIAVAGTLTGQEIAAERDRLDLEFKRPETLPATGPSLNASGGSAPVTLQPGSYNGIKAVNNATLELQPGTYYIRDKVEVNAASLNCVGATEDDPVILYIGKGMELDQGAILNGGGAGNPRHLQVYFCDEDTVNNRPHSSLDVNNQSQVNMVAAGRWLTATVSQSDLFGALIAVGVVGDGGGLHFDTSLKGDPMRGSAQWNVTTVRDMLASEVVGGTNGGSGPPPPRPPDLYLAQDNATSATGNTGGSNNGNNGNGNGNNGPGNGNGNNGPGNGNNGPGNGNNGPGNGNNGPGNGNNGPGNGNNGPGNGNNGPGNGNNGPGNGNNGPGNGNNGPGNGNNGPGNGNNGPGNGNNGPGNGNNGNGVGDGGGGGTGGLSITIDGGT